MERKDFLSIFNLIEESSSWDIHRKCMEPLIYISETSDEIIITVDLPCVTKENITVRATEDSIEIEAKVRTPLKFERWGVRQRETFFSSFKKVVKLSSKIDTEKVKAKFRKGILKIVAPKIIKKREIKVE